MIVARHNESGGSAENKVKVKPDYVSLFADFIRNSKGAYKIEDMEELTFPQIKAFNSNWRYLDKKEKKEQLAIQMEMQAMATMQAATISKIKKS